MNCLDIGGQGAKHFHEMASDSSVSSEQTAALGHTEKDGFLVDVKAIHTFSKLNV